LSRAADSSHSEGFRWKPLPLKQRLKPFYWLAVYGTPKGMP